MKRCINNIWLVSAIAVLTACQKSAPLVPDGGDAVSFGVEWSQDADAQWSDAKTKASLTDKNTIADFGVFAYYDEDGSFDNESTPYYMNNVEVSKVDADWSYSPERFWPAAGAISFFAYSPYGLAGLTVNATVGKPQFTYSIPNKVTTQKDLLISKPLIDQTKAQLTGDKKTLITFQHALACLNITGAVAKAMTQPVKITKVVVSGLNKKGEFSFDNDYALLTSGQTNTGDYTLTANANANAKNGALSEVDIKGILEPQTPKVSVLTDSGYPMIIPQTVSADATIAVTITNGSNTETITRKLNTLFIKFESGKRYTINIKMASLTDVTITATVQPWETATVNVPSFN